MADVRRGAQDGARAKGFGREHGLASRDFLPRVSRVGAVGTRKRGRRTQSLCCIGWACFSFFAKLAEQMKVQMAQYRRTFEVSRLGRLFLKFAMTSRLIIVPG